MLELAATLARRGDPALSTRHWVAAVQTETLAGLGDLDGCQRALDIAAHVQGLRGPVHNGGWLRFDGSRLAEERGTCYVALGRADKAETALTDALSGALTARRKASVTRSSLSSRQPTVPLPSSPATRRAGSSPCAGSARSTSTSQTRSRPTSRIGTTSPPGSRTDADIFARIEQDVPVSETPDRLPCLCWWSWGLGWVRCVT